MITIQDRSFEFACRIVLLHQDLLRMRGAGRSLAGQLLSSGTSIGSNLEEASGGQSKADFIAKCRIALKEARESRFWLKLFARTRIITPETAAPLIQEATEIIAILTTILKKATRSRVRGREYVDSPSD